MNCSKCYNLLAIAALVLSAGWVIAWAGGLLTGTAAWPARFGLLSVGLTLAGGSVALWLRHRQRRYQDFRQYLEALCALDPRNVDGGDAPGNASTLPADDPWSHLADRVREAFLDHGRRLQELEHARTASEIRARRAAAKAEQIEAILSGMPDPVLAVDDYDELLLANRSAEELFQFNLRDAETRALAQLVHCQKLVDLLSATRHRKTSAARADEIDIPDQQGTPRSFRVTATKLSGPSDRPHPTESAHRGAVAVLRDIGDHKALQKRNAEFVSAVSHEMKTPLAGIKAYVELLVDGDAEDEQTQEEFLDVINSQADRLQRLIDNMLNLARIEAGVVRVSKRAQSLNELLQEAYHVVQPSAEARQIQLVSDLSPMYLGVLADRDMLLQAAINLLSNAVKYTPEGGRVALRSRLEQRRVRFEVQDTGVGLSPEDCQRVFEKFYRVSKDKNMASGTGLGLPLAKHIVEDVHGGRLSVESTIGEGSTFIVTMPGSGELT